MPRGARLSAAGIPWHIVQRGAGRAPCFRAPHDYERFLFELNRRAREADVAVHAYVLMTNHVHLLVTPVASDGCAKLMKVLAQTYARFFNKTYGRTGTLWEGRFRSSLVQSAAYVLACYRYIERNPVRAGMVDHPRDYPWSSYLANAEGRHCGWLTPHSEYIALGKSANRPDAYRRLFEDGPAEAEEREIRVATTGNAALGAHDLAAALAEAGEH